MASRHSKLLLQQLRAKIDRNFQTAASLLVIANQVPSRDRLKPFPVANIQSELNSDTFRENKHAFQLNSEKFKQILQLSNAGGGEKAIARHVKQHRKLLPMDRIRLLLDSEGDFLELSTIAGFQMAYGDVPKAGVVTGLKIS